MPLYKKLIVILDRQHVGKPGRNDLGAGVDLDNNGVVDFDEREANLTPILIDACRKKLEQAGAKVYVFQSGSYWSRHQRAVEIAEINPDALVPYIAQHLNAGGGSYSAGFYDERSRNGAKLAMNIAGAFSAADLPGISRTITRQCGPVGDWTNAYATIIGVYAGPANICGYCSEPVFMDNLAHRSHLTPDGLKRLGELQAEGILSFFIGSTT